MTDEPRVWNLRDKKNPPPRGAVYCGRGTPYGNPYVAGRHGSRETVIRKFVEFVLPDLDVSHLKGKHLVCWCAPLPCHADHIFMKANSDVQRPVEDQPSDSRLRSRSSDGRHDRSASGE